MDDVRVEDGCVWWLIERTGGKAENDDGVTHGAGFVESQQGQWQKLSSNVVSAVLVPADLNYSLQTLDT